MGWFTNPFQKVTAHEAIVETKPNLPKGQINAEISKGKNARSPEDCILHILDEGGRSREMKCAIGEHVSREIYERNKDSEGHLYGFVFQQQGKSLMQIAHKDIWLGAQRKIEDNRSEVRQVSFHCAKDGTEFFVECARESATDKFRIRLIDAPRAKEIVRGQKTFMEWARGKFRADASGDSSLAKSFDAKEFDFSGWQCACCGHNSWPQYIRCSKCHRLVCGSKVISIQNGPKTYQCAPDCGNSGVVEGEISSYDTKRLEMEVAKRHASELPLHRSSEITSSNRTMDDQSRSGEEKPKQLFKR